MAPIKSTEVPAYSSPSAEGGEEGRRDGKGRKIRREGGRNEHKREGKGKKMDRKKGDMKGDKDGKKENRWEGRWVGGKLKSDYVLPSLTVGFLCVGGPSVFV